MRRRPALHMSFVLELLINFGLPWLAYREALPLWGEHGALLASALPPVLWSLVEVLWHRRMDALSLFVLAGILLSLLAVGLGGNARILLMRESLISGAFGLAFLLSASLRRPLMYYLARATVTREGAEALTRFDARCLQDNGRAAPWLTVLSATWGAGLLLEMLLRFWLTAILSITTFLLIAPWVSYSIYGMLGGWTWWYRRHLRTRAQVTQALSAQLQR